MAQHLRPLECEGRNGVEVERHIAAPMPLEALRSDEVWRRSPFTSTYPGPSSRNDDGWRKAFTPDLSGRGVAKMDTSTFSC